MIVDVVENLTKYESLNPLFKKVVAFISANKLEDLATGHYEIDGDDVYVNIVDSPVKTKAEARLETHRRMIDIQIPLSSSEMQGFTPLSHLSDAEYDEANDISFYDGEADTYYTLQTGEFAIYFPQDGHAPAITDRVLRKAIFKVRV